MLYSLKFNFAVHSIPETSARSATVSNVLDHSYLAEILDSPVNGQQILQDKADGEQVSSVDGCCFKVKKTGCLETL